MLVLGDRPGLTPTCTVGETRDSAELILPGVQERLAAAILALGKPVIVVLVTGRPYAISGIAEKADAILEAWLPGEEGGAAIVETLLGENNPGGKLPLTFPRHVGQVPIYYNHKPSAGRSNWWVNYVSVDASPLYPFGHGLSYTSFGYSDFALARTEVAAGEALDISVKITNTGSWPGKKSSSSTCRMNTPASRGRCRSSRGMSGSRLRPAKAATSPSTCRLTNWLSTMPI